MEITTKFNLGDRVFFLYYNRVHSLIIEDIKIEVDGYKAMRNEGDVRQEISYCFIKNDNTPRDGKGKWVFFSEDLCFASKDELLNSL